MGSPQGYLQKLDHPDHERDRDREAVAVML
jgi:hypothetical protein